MNDTPATKPRVAFLGLGIMGAGMSRRLLGAGFPLTVYNRTRARAETLAAAGATVASTAREAVHGASFIFSMVSDDAASRELWLGADGALAGASRGSVAIESSTVTVGWVETLAAAAAKHRVEFLDAPVTGSKVQANAGELRFLVGGAAGILAAARPVLAAMSQEVFHLGPVGSGARMKLINNFMAGVQVAVIAEAMAMIEHSGLDRTQALNILTQGAPGSPMVRTMAGRMTAKDYAPNFMLRLMAKDLGYAAGEAQARGISLATAAAAQSVFQKAIAAGLGDQDMSALVEIFRS